MNIDFSNAPEGYPIWIESKNGKGSGWHKDDGAFYVDQNGKYWVKSHGHLYDVHFMKEWTGGGLPPVGPLEYKSNSGWSIGKCVAVEDGYAVIWVNCGMIFAVSAHHKNQLRPIRTAEQIVAEEREAKAKAMYLSIYFAEPPESWDSGPDTRRETFRKAIDAGWQQVQP